MSSLDSPSGPSALDRARTKAYRRLLPILFLCYVVAYVDRNNLAIAIETMQQDMPAFDKHVLGIGAGIFFLGYFLLEIPGSILVEKWSARKWISRIMISWGLVAACTAAVKTPGQLYTVRFLLGLAEAGFFPGVIVYLTHWFPNRDRTRALAWFLIGTPVAQAISPLISYPLLSIGTVVQADGTRISDRLAPGLHGWQWVFIAWGVPAVVLGFVVLRFLTDRPRQAKWLTEDEREALETELERERAEHKAKGHMTLGEAFRNPKVLVLAAAYFFIVTGNYGVEFFLPSILKEWYNLTNTQKMWLLTLPAAGSLAGQLFIGWNSDRTKERRLHAAAPIYLGAAALALTVVARHPLPLMMVLFILVGGGPEGVPAGVLGLAQPVPDLDGGGRQHRLHQLRGQPRRLPRPLRDGLAQRIDEGPHQIRLPAGRLQRLHARHPVPVRLDNRRRDHHHLAAPGPPSGQGRADRPVAGGDAPVGSPIADHSRRVRSAIADPTDDPVTRYSTNARSHRVVGPRSRTSTCPRRRRIAASRSLPIAANVGGGGGLSITSSAAIRQDAGFRR